MSISAMGLKHIQKNLHLTETHFRFNFNFHNNFKCLPLGCTVNTAVGALAVTHLTEDG